MSMIKGATHDVDVWIILIYIYIPVAKSLLSCLP